MCRRGTAPQESTSLPGTMYRLAVAPTSRLPVATLNGKHESVFISPFQHEGPRLNSRSSLTIWRLSFLRSLSADHIIGELHGDCQRCAMLAQKENYPVASHSQRRDGVCS